MLARRAGESWHGFRDADADHMFLDPVKVTILTPGMDEQGVMGEEGIPAALVAKFLDERGVVVEKAGPIICCSCSASGSIKPVRWGCSGD